MKRLILLVLTLALMVGVSPAQAHYPVLDESALSTPVFDKSPFGEPEMTPKQERKWHRVLYNAARRNGMNRAQAAHFTYTYDVMWQNLMDTNLDRACGWGANQYCPSDDPNRRPRAPFRSWVGDHSLGTEFIWSQYTYCAPGCDVWDYCDVNVHVTDHNDGGRVNVNYAGTKYVWESSCNISGPISTVP